MIVIDASAAVKLLFDEDDSVAVRDWFRRIDDELVAPDLLNIEVTRAVVRRVNAGQIVNLPARAKLREWSAFLETNAISLRRSDVAQVQAAADLAITFGHPLADCLYLALAIELGCNLATCDEKFRAKVASLHPQVRAIADFG